MAALLRQSVISVLCLMGIWIATVANGNDRDPLFISRGNRVILVFIDVHQEFQLKDGLCKSQNSMNVERAMYMHWYAEQNNETGSSLLNGIF